MKRPGPITFFCIVGFIFGTALLAGLLLIPSARNSFFDDNGYIIGSGYVVILVGYMIGLVGYWIMKKWGVFAILITLSIHIVVFITNIFINQQSNFDPNTTKELIGPILLGMLGISTIGRTNIDPVVVENNKKTWNFIVSVKLFFGLLTILFVGFVYYYNIIRQPSIQECSAIISESDRDYCYKRIAFATHQTSDCDLINSTHNRADCYGYVGAFQQDALVCYSLKTDDSETSIDSCLGSMADYLGKATKDILICDKVLGSLDQKEYKFTCYAEVAKLKEDQQYCSIITDDFQRDRCYLDLAVQTKDPVLCSYIEGDSIKRNCELYVK